MTSYVPRTCTEIRGDVLPGRQPDVLLVHSRDDSVDWHRLLAGDESADVVGRSRAVEEFRGCDAYVLLGALGAGKSSVFEFEAGCSRCTCVTACDFLTFDIKPGWCDTTLFIDGLDEMRAGSPDGRTPLDAIRARLDALGRPRFRLSCREADWFGASDRTRLARVARGGAARLAAVLAGESPVGAILSLAP